MPEDRRPTNWKHRRRRVYERDDYTCQRCGARGGTEGDRRVVAHHVVPRSEGGTDDTSNLLTLCDRCHARTHPENAALDPVGDGESTAAIEAIRRTFDEYETLLPIHVAGNRYAVVEHRTAGEPTVNAWHVNVADGTCDCPADHDGERICAHVAKATVVHPAAVHADDAWITHHVAPLRGECWAPLCVGDLLDSPADLDVNESLLAAFFSGLVDEDA